MIAPGSWLGLLGGGQLGRMFCMAAQSLGYKVLVLDPGSDSAAGAVADAHIQAGYTDPDGLRALATRCRAATTEFENVPAEALRFLSRHARVSPPPEAVAIAQDRIAEKHFLAEHGFALAPHAVLRQAPEAAQADPRLFPGILKSSRLGYDGKGQIRVEASHELPPAFQGLGGQPCVLERRLELAGELSVIVARNEYGNASTWPVAENLHRDGILDTSIVPARLPEPVAEQARSIALAVAAKLDYSGVLCVELFLLQGGRLVVNEIAPRPHNSGHSSIDACLTSQFEQQVRVLASLPLGDTRQHTPAVMVNLLGELWYEGAVLREPPWERLLRMPQVKLHLYGKSQPRRGRKMGHVTCLAASLDEALATAHAVKTLLGIPQGHEKRAVEA